MGTPLSSADTPYLHGLMRASRMPWQRPVLPLRFRVALFYAGRLKWPLFPCNEHKRPLVDGGFHAASCDPHKIEHWWRQWPNALIGVATGELSGLVVVDVDRKGGVDGAETLRKAGYCLPRSWIARTRSGGLHVYTRWPGEDIRSGAAVRVFGKRLAGVDLRASGGYVIVPGPRDGYRWTRFRPGRFPLSPMPHWLRAGLAWRPPPIPISQHRPNGSAPDAGRQLDDIVAQICGAQEGTRNETLAMQSWRAGRLVAEGRVQRANALAAILNAARHIGGPDWDHRLGEATAKRRFEAGMSGHG